MTSPYNSCTAGIRGDMSLRAKEGALCAGVRRPAPVGDGLRIRPDRRGGIAGTPLELVIGANVQSPARHLSAARQLIGPCGIGCRIPNFSLRAEGVPTQGGMSFEVMTPACAGVLTAASQRCPTRLDRTAVEEGATRYFVECPARGTRRIYNHEALAREDQHPGTVPKLGVRICLEADHRKARDPLGAGAAKVAARPEGSRATRFADPLDRDGIWHRARSAASWSGYWRRTVEDDIYKRLLERLRELRAAAVGFSGGTGSTLLLAAAKEVLGGRLLALTAVTPFMERQEVADTLTLSAQLGVRHELVELAMPQGIEANPPARCYICKHALFGRLLEVAREAGFGCLLDGSNLDDSGDYRPGLRALRELEIDSPLLSCKISKADVRRISEALGLPTWNKPTNACLLTRLSIGQRVTMEDLHRVEEAERFLRARGYVWIRVRVHQDLARVEVAPEQRLQLLAEAETVSKVFKELGFRHIALDLRGYQLGSMSAVGIVGDEADTCDALEFRGSLPGDVVAHRWSQDLTRVRHGLL
jgi:uncharacterized protein